MAEGKIYFVGVGPGDPELMTIKAHKILSKADVIIYTGSLLDKRILELFPKAEKIDSHGMTVDEIVDIMKKRFYEGKIVARVHDGDPSIFGSTKEYFELLEKDGIDFEVVPGVSSFIAAAASLKTEYTIPELTQTVVITRYPGRTPVPEDIKEFMKQKPTMIFFLSIALIDKIVKDFLDAGYPPSFPCAVCYRVSWEDEKIIMGTLQDIAEKVKAENITSHALFIISKAFESYGQRSFIYSQKYSEIVRKAKEKKYEKAENIRKNIEAELERRKEELLRKIFKNGVALLAITRGGINIVSSLAQKLEFEKVDVFIPQKFFSGGNFITFQNLKETLWDIFDRYSAIICVMSLGALVRLISPKLRGKEKDPAVLCIDETGKFVISVLSGHVGGANELTRKVAKLLGATPVITTASDSLGTIPVDILGREFGWKVHADHDTLVKVSSAVVNDEKLAIVQESGELFFSLPKNAEYFTDLSDFLPKQEEFSACLFISHRKVEKDIFKIPTVIYNPKVLYVGIGFDKGVSYQEMYQFLEEVFERFSLSLYSIKKVGTVDIKSSDEEFRKFSEILKERFDVEVEFVPKDKLAGIEVKNPSEQARKYLGIPSVSEAVSLFLAGSGGKLIVEKQKKKFSKAGMTLAVSMS